MIQFKSVIGTRTGILALVIVVSFAGRVMAQADVTAPGDPTAGVLAVAGGNSSIAVAGTTAGANNFPAGESPHLSIDNDIVTKYLNFAELNTGIIVVPSFGPSIVSGIRVTTANDAPERDPLTFTLEGTNAADPFAALGAAWSLICSGDTGLQTDPGRRMAGPLVACAGVNSFSSYRLLFPTVRNSVAANSMQVSEVEILGVPEPTTSLLTCGLIFGAVAVRRAMCRTVRTM